MEQKNCLKPFNKIQPFNSMYISFDQMPDQSRIWIYTSPRKFEKKEIETLSTKLLSFCQTWNTHGNLMPTSYDIRFDQVILLAVDESQLGASGCSIDSSVRVLRDIENEFQIDLLDQGKVSFFKNHDDLEVKPILGIKSKVYEGLLKAETMILNPVVQIKSDLDKNWKIQAKESWLVKFFEN